MVNGAVLVLNRHYQPVHVTNVKRAVSLLDQGVARAVAYAAQAGLPAYWPASEQFLQTGQKIPGELHSAYHEYLFKLSKLKDRLWTPAARRIAEGRHQAMAQFFTELAEELDGRA